MKTILVTGGCGFIGSNFIKFTFDNFPSCKVINLDSLTYASNSRINKIFKNNPNYKFYNLDITKKSIYNLLLEHEVDIVVNFAAETHVDNSIINSSPFINSNIIGVHNLLMCSLKYNKLEKFIQISTDEVYGSINLEDKVKKNEQSLLSPRNPYSASKASGEMLCFSFYETFKLPIVITRSSNNYGENQNPEKFIPKTLKNIQENRPIEIYGSGENIRNWIHVEDHCSAIWKVINKGNIGEIYNISSNQYLSNNELVELIISFINNYDIQINYIEDRQSHDLKYSIDSSKIEKLGWKPTLTLQDFLSSISKNL